MNDNTTPFPLALLATLAVALAAGAALAWAVQNRGAPALSPHYPATLTRLQKILPGEALGVTAAPGFQLSIFSAGTLLVRHGEILENRVEIDLCEQRSRARHDLDVLIPLRVGGGYAEIQAQAQHNRQRGHSPALGIKNPLLGEGLPRFAIGGHGRAGAC